MKPLTIAPDVSKQTRERTAKNPGRSHGFRESAATPHLELYQKEDCPYSHRVRSVLSDLGMNFVAHSVPAGNALKHQQLVQAGGKDQVPFLIDHRTGTKLYESDRIESYLRKEYGTEQPNPLYRLAEGLNRRVMTRADRLRWRTKITRERVGGLVGDVRDTVSGSIRLVRSFWQPKRPARKRAA